MHRISLVAPLEEAQTRIDERIRLGIDGQQWLAKLYSQATDHGADEPATDWFRRWDDVNAAILARLFDHEAPHDEYKSDQIHVPPGATSSVRQALLSPRFWVPAILGQRLTRLRSIRDRLEIWNVPPPPAAGGYAPSSEAMKRVFVVHGHDPSGIRIEVAKTISDVGLKPVLLGETPNQGFPTLIEKLEREGDCGFVLVVFTGDDRGAGVGNALAARARQNVVFEFGYFIGHVGRRRVALLYETGTEIFSDVSGGAYYPIDASGTWRTSIIREFAIAKLPGQFDGVLSNAVKR